MSSTPPLRPFPEFPKNIHLVDVELARASTISANFPNPNTHHFADPAAIYSLLKPTAPGTGCPTTLAPLLKKIHCEAARIPLPPTPPPKNTPLSLRPPTGPPPIKLPPGPSPVRPVDIPHSRALPPLTEHQLPLPNPLPSGIFHRPPILPPQKSFRPLIPRPQFVPTRDAPARPISTLPETNVRSYRAALLPEAFISHASSIRHCRHALSWVTGVTVFLGGLVCFVSGLTLMGMSAHNSGADAGGGLDIAAGLLAAVGFGSSTGSTTHLIWLYCTRRGRNREADIENGTRPDPGNSTLLDRRSARLSRAGKVLSMVSKRMTDHPEQSKRSNQESDQVGMRFALLSPTHNRIHNHSMKRQDQISRGGSSIGHPRTHSPPDPSQIHAAFEDTPDIERDDDDQPNTDYFSRARSGRTPLLKMDDEEKFSATNAKDKNNIDRARGNLKVQRSRSRQRKPINQAVDRVQMKSDLRNDRGTSQRPHHQSTVQRPLRLETPARDRSRAAERAKRGISKERKRRVHGPRPSPIYEKYDLEEHCDRRSQNLIHVAAIFDQLVKGKELQQQHSDSLSTQPVRPKPPVSGLTIDASDNVVSALGSKTQLSGPAKASEKSQGKQKEIDGPSITREDTNATISKAQIKPPTKIGISAINSHQSDLQNRDSLNFQEATLALPPAPTPSFFANNNSTTTTTAKTPLRPISQSRSSSDSQILNNPQSHSTSDLLQRIARAHALANSRAATPTATAAEAFPPSTEDVLHDDTRFSGPLLPALAYDPNASMQRTVVDGGSGSSSTHLLPPPPPPSLLTTAAATALAAEEILPSNPHQASTQSDLPSSPRHESFLFGEPTQQGMGFRLSTTKISTPVRAFGKFLGAGEAGEVWWGGHDDGEGAEDGNVKEVRSE